MLLKFTAAPSETLPIQSPSLTGLIEGLSRYQAIGFSLEPLNGIEISIGLDKSIFFRSLSIFISTIIA